MGSFHSIPSRSGRRRTNRLSKPLTKKVSFLRPISRKSPPTNSSITSPVSPRSIPRKTPLNSASVPVNPSVSNHHDPLPQSLRSAPSQSKSLRRVSAWSRNKSVAEEENPDKHRHDLPSPNPSAAASMSRRPSLRPTRRASFQPESLRDVFQPGNTPGQPKRSYSVQSLPQSPRGTIYEDALEEATSSNTYFMVDNQRFSLTRRRSLLTRPGVATRKSSQQSVRRLSPPINQDPESPSDGFAERQTLLQPPFPETEDATAKSIFASTSTRPDTPSDFEYTHLGALKLGSLRVVNGSASPSSSDRTRLDISRSTSPEISSDDVYTKESTVTNHTNSRKLYGHRSSSGSKWKTTSSDTSMFQISASPDKEDVPGSPFSFEKSPTMATFPRHASFLTQEEDEGISLPNEKSLIDDGASLLWKAHMRPHDRKRHSRSLAKADSGYSSATSARSSQYKPTRRSIDSQRPERQPRGSRKVSASRGFEGHGDHVENSLGLNYLDPIRRHSNRQVSRYDRSQQLQPDTPLQSPRFADSTALRRAMSFSRPLGPLDSLEASTKDAAEAPIPQRRRAGSIRGQASHSYQNFHALNSSRLSRHQSISFTGTEQRIPGVPGIYNTRNYTRLNNADAADYDRFDHYRPQNQSIHRSSTARAKQTRADMVNEHYRQSNNNLGGKSVLPRHSTDFALRKSISFLERMEPVAETDYGTLAGGSCDRVRNPSIDEQQIKYARPVKRRSLNMSTSPFIFK
ncbi:uncharacterized protein ASPGLDRAFT_23271 [Aspergillus glaucus CBS 516.65]|uniref:Uncharacterized protein n=1 Tax=Aspergillus glaucus CBS 516.65 TaxID=1160497 RepID=A0A1L9VTL7_ASPGL|nr:hypothetical protein ASPGLDRAFT_23271 [Aspergillus glaucus CBS 516.65]OJJ87240.1 hypothetical protein ASPGLDRAFT_23271 [Aspergillus glaucus CBS 516.65]